MFACTLLKKCPHAFLKVFQQPCSLPTILITVFFLHVTSRVALSHKFSLVVHTLVAIETYCNPSFNIRMTNFFTHEKVNVKLKLAKNSFKKCFFPHHCTVHGHQISGQNSVKNVWNFLQALGIQKHHISNFAIIDKHSMFYKQSYKQQS